MCKLKQLTESYNYYPRTMIRLSEIAYKDIGSIPNAVKTLGFKVVWGPAEQVDVFDVSYSLMYIAMRSEPYQEYVVVIRGTNMESWESWVEEDFNIASTKPFRDFGAVLQTMHASHRALITA